MMEDGGYVVSELQINKYESAINGKWICHSMSFHLLFSLSQVITPFRKLMLCAESRKEMEDWISALKSVQKWETYEVIVISYK